MKTVSTHSIETGLPKELLRASMEFILITEIGSGKDFSTIRRNLESGAYDNDIKSGAQIMQNEFNN